MKTNAQTQQDYFATIVMPFLCTFGFIVTVIVLIPIVRYRKKYFNPFYIFLIAIAILDCFCLLDLIYNALCSLQNKCPGGPLVEAIITDASWYFYYCTAFVYLCMAWNRLASVALYKHLAVVFSSRMITTVKIRKLVGIL